MKLRYLFISVVGCLGALSTYAQNNNQIGDKSVFERLTNIEKKSNRFNLFLNTHGAFDVNMNDGSMQNSGFKFEQLRLEAYGDITNKVYYRYRQRLNRPNNPQALDNLPNSLDYAAVGYRVSDKFSIFAGKQSTVYGGFEFDENPIDIYQYCDMIEYMSNFMVGSTFGYKFNDNQELLFQVLNSRNGSFTDMYGALPAYIEQSKLSLAYTLNWNASFWDNLLKLRWSATVLNQAKKKNTYYFAAGQELNVGKIQTYVDFLMSYEQLDSKRIVTDIMDNLIPGQTAQNVRYMTLLWKFNYRVSPKFNLFAKAMYETATVYKSYDAVTKGKLRTSLGYFGGIEYFPMDSGLHFFFTFVGRGYSFTDRAKVDFGEKNFNTQRFSLGLIYKIPMY